MHRRRSPRALLLLAALLACATPGASRVPVSLENTTWRLIDLGGPPAVGVEGDPRAHLQFFDDGRVAGGTGCNRLSGSYTRVGEDLRFGPAATTRMACVDPRLNQREQAFLAALTSTERHRVDGDTLVLIGKAGPVARLLRVGAR